MNGTPAPRAPGRCERRACALRDAGGAPGRLLAALALTAIAAAPGRAQAPLEALRPAVEARIAEHRGIVGFAVLDPETGESMAVRGDEPFPAASVIKVPLLVEVFHQVEHGRLRLDDPLVMLEADKQPGSGLLQHLSAPHHLTVRDAAVLAIVVSDNTATNLLIDRVGIRGVWDRMEALGLPRTKLHSKTFLRETSVAPDSSARYGLGVTTPLEAARLFAAIRNGDAVSPEASADMVEILARQFYAEGIPRGLPPGTRVAHKTGALAAARHDCGIVFAPRDFVLCVLTRENEDRSWGVDNEAHRLSADLARLTYAHLNPAGPPEPVP